MQPIRVWRRHKVQGPFLKPSRCRIVTVKELRLSCLVQDKVVLPSLLCAVQRILDRLDFKLMLFILLSLCLQFQDIAHRRSNCSRRLMRSGCHCSGACRAARERLDGGAMLACEEALLLCSCLLLPEGAVPVQVRQVVVN